MFFVCLSLPGKSSCEVFYSPAKVSGPFIICSLGSRCSLPIPAECTGGSFSIIGNSPSGSTRAVVILQSDIFTTSVVLSGSETTQGASFGVWIFLILLFILLVRWVRPGLKLKPRFWWSTMGKAMHWLPEVVAPRRISDATPYTELASLEDPSSYRNRRVFGVKTGGSYVPPIFRDA